MDNQKSSTNNSNSIETPLPVLSISHSSSSSVHNIPSNPHSPNSASPELEATTESPPRSTTQPTTAPGSRRVQWPAELSRHASIVMNPQTSSQPPVAKNLQDLGATAALTLALEEHSRRNSIAETNQERPNFVETPFDFTPSEPVSRAESTDDEVYNEKMAAVKDSMSFFVDSGETDGLPSIRAGGIEAQGGKKAWQLVRGLKSGIGIMRLRKNAGFKSGQGLGVTDPQVASPRSLEDGDELSQKEGGFFSNLLNNQNSNISGEPDGMGFPSGSISGTGVLSALMALQQEQQGTASGGTSLATTPNSTAPPSRRSSTINSSDDEDEEEEERRKFTYKQREKRANKNAWNGVADVGKSVAGGVIGGAGYALGGASYAVGGVTHALGFGHRRSQSVEPSPRLYPSSASRRSSPNTSISGTPPANSKQLDTPEGILSMRKKKGFFGETVNQVKKIGDRLGLELDSTMLRPNAAKSSAGVFGGLMLSANNLAGVAAPAANTLAPLATRPGYHLSRYSVPEPPTHRRRSRDNSRPTSFIQGSTSHPATRAQSPILDDHDEKKDGNESDIEKDEEGSSTTAHSDAPSVKDSGSTAPLKSSLTSASMIPSTSKSGLNLHLGDLSHLPKFSFHSNSRPPSLDTPRKGGSTGNLVDYFAGHKETQEEREAREWEKEKRRRRKAKEKRKANEVFITRHVAAILARQDFIMKMARSFMMFGAPSHRLEGQLQATARVLEINCQVIYLPGVMLCSFGDTATHTSEIKFLKQANGLDLGRLLSAYYVYYKVIHDQISVTEASVELDQLMVSPPIYNLWQNLLIGGLASAFIQPSAFYGSFIDCLVSIPLGALLVLVQVVASKNDLYSSLFEIVIAAVNAFLAAALASTGYFCFSSVASGAVVLILPGYIVLCGSLELANRSIISGSVRLVYALLYALFLGFGLAIGSEVYERVTGLSITGGSDFTCSALRVNAPWYQATITPWVYFLTIPAYLLMLGLRNGQPLVRKETVIMLIIGMFGFAANYFSGKAFVNRADISSAMGSFAVGFLGNMYGKFTKGSPFVVMVVGVLIQLPSGLSNGGGLLQFATLSTTAGISSFSVGFAAAESLIEVSIGLTVGLFVSAALVNLLGGGRRRGSNLSSF